MTGTLERTVFHHLNVLSEESLDRTRCKSELVFSASQEIQEKNRLFLDTQTGETRLDAHRAVLPAAVLHDMTEVTESVLRAFDGHPDDGQPVEPVVGAYGAVAHEVGTARIGRVVDTDLQLLGYEDRMYVCDNSVFPVSPSTNPTILLAALVLRLASHLSHRFKQV